MGAALPAPSVAHRVDLGMEEKEQRALWDEVFGMLPWSLVRTREGDMGSEWG